MTISKRNIPIALPCLGEDEWRATKEVFESGWVTQGPKVKEFEEEFAKLHGVSHALAVTSCTTGLHLALAGLDIGPEDEVLVPAFTWVATANVVEHLGAKPVFVDIDLKTFNLDPRKIKSALSAKTKAIIPVHLFGLCADMDEIRNSLPSGVKIIEDAACAAGAGYKGQRAGSLGDVASFSLHPRKSITTGEGGMVTTDHKGLAEKMEKLRNHGASISEEQRHQGPRPYLLPDFDLLGFNYRMTDIQGAVGLVQLTKLMDFIGERERRAQFYISELESISWLTTYSPQDQYQHGWQSFVVRVDEIKSPMKRNELMEALQQKGISTRPGTHAVHTLGYYQNKYQIKPEDYPMASLAQDTSMAIPLHNKMTEEDYQYVVQELKGL